MLNNLIHFFKATWSLIAGIGVTIRYAFKPRVTLEYPKKRLSPPRFKGPIEFVKDEKTGDHKCISCNACIKICPSACMSLKAERNANNKRVLTDFKVNHNLCSLCSLCIAVCPTDALAHSMNYDEAAYTKDDFIHDLMAPFPKPVIAAQKTEPPPQPPSALSSGGTST